MVAPVLTVADRAAAALMGAVIGAQLGIDPVADADAPHGVRLAPELPESPWPAAGAIAVEAARAFAGRQPNLRSFALALGEWGARDGRGASPGLRAALQLLHEHQVPPTHAHGAIGEPLLAAIPIGIVARGSARNMASAATHTAALLAPHPLVQQAAIAMAVAAGHLASGQSDFIPEVLEALKVDGAPEELLAIPRRVPVTRREELGAVVQNLAPTSAVLMAALWCADRERVAGRGAAQLTKLDVAADVRSAACAAGLGLMALRDGIACIPAAWRDAMPGLVDLERLGRSLA